MANYSPDRSDEERQKFNIEVDLLVCNPALLLKSTLAPNIEIRAELVSRSGAEVQRSGKFVHLNMTVEDASRLGKYPPAKPGALGLEPPGAAEGVADAAPEGWAT